MLVANSVSYSQVLCDSFKVLLTLAPHYECTPIRALQTGQKILL